MKHLRDIKGNHEINKPKQQQQQQQQQKKTKKVK